MMKNVENIQPKKLLLYQAVIQLLEEGADVNKITISDITKKAGIGKGTAYDYFQSKEDVIIEGVMFYMDKILEEAQGGMDERKNLRAKIEYLFEILETNLHERGCLLKVVHLMLGFSQVSSVLQDCIREGKVIMPLIVIEKLVKDSIASGEMKNTYPLPYVVYTITCRLLTYAALLDFKGEDRPLYAMGVDMRDMRKFTLEGIMQEFAI